ncbi:hypothetical protein CYMTET_47828 [Cymbomonas tetramitiformis]|uniref:Uncharacterized protein n=1 Tax=Cymbomonas tetramitiformis TaxID=36881 RepID=A0AAE0EW88_9CHLO|nr:hypothetical protein CYMTET_47828 [Cymbomonas tetramitiformis]
MSTDEAAEQGSVFRLPIKCLYHAKGYEAGQDQERGWVNEIKSDRKRNPWAPFNAGLVAVDGVKSRAEFSLQRALKGENNTGARSFGHQHCFQATDECCEEDPLEIAFQYFESKIYIGIEPDMIRFLGEMQNTIDQMQKGRSNTEFMQGLRSTLFEKHGVLYTIYREALISEFEASAPEDGENEGDTPGPGQYTQGRRAGGKNGEIRISSWIFTPGSREISQGIRVHRGGGGGRGRADVDARQCWTMTSTLTSIGSKVGTP